MTDPAPGRDRDPRHGDHPLRVRDQPALRTSTGAEWLLIGALLAAICVVVLLVQGLALSAGAAALVAGLFVAMVVVRLVVSPRRPRLVALAVLLGAMPVVTLGALLLVLAR